jgi:pilus assembly protein FimV
VLKSILQKFAYLACLAFSSMTFATGLGSINVTSGLGQPLKAEIEMVAVDKADRASISAKLASADAFKNAGIDYPYSLPKLKFEVINRDSANPSIRVTTSQPVNDPFVTLLLEVNWSSGKLLREYTFLLDPVDFKAVEPKAEVVTPIAPVVVAPVAAPAPAPEVAPVASEPAPVVVAPEIAVTPVTSAPVATQAAEPVAETTAPAEIAARASAEAAPAEVAPIAQEPVAAASVAQTKLGAEQVTVSRGDSLSKIALLHKPAEVSLERMLVAMYRANPDAFVNKNMNRLRTGKVVRLPDATELDAVQQKEASREVRAQVADWNAYRQQLASAQTPVKETAPRQEATGKVTAAVAETAPVNAAPAKEVLKLSKGEAPSDKAVNGGKTSAQEKANAKAEEAIAKAKALKEAQDRNALLEKNVKDLQRLAELRKQGAATATAASSPKAATPATSASAPAVASPKVAAPIAAADESLMDSPTLLAAGAALLLALGGAAFYFVKRNKKSGAADSDVLTKSNQEDFANATGRITLPVMPSPDTGDFTQTTSLDSSANSASDEIDPIGEADLFLTFGRDVQAEEVLTEALKSHPNNTAVRLKLLSIYESRKDANAFFTHAKLIKESGDASAWNKAASMGQLLDPSNALYGGAGDVASEITLATRGKSEQAAVDFDLGFDSPVAAQTAPDFQGTVSLEKPTFETTAVLSASELAEAHSSPMDFDVTATHPGFSATGDASETPTINLNDVMFDVTGTNPTLNVADAGLKHSDIDSLFFDVTSSQPVIAESKVVEAKPATSAADEGMAFTLDFPTSFAVSMDKKPEAPASAGFSGISLSLDDLSAPASGEGKSEHWQEVATKLDLARAYQEMGDADGAKEILEEAMRDGDAQQREAAQVILQQL